jgi:hypothetical protein
MSGFISSSIADAALAVTTPNLHRSRRSGDRVGHGPFDQADDQQPWASDVHYGIVHYGYGSQGT